MELLTNRAFGGLTLDIFVNQDEFYMSRRQINEALEYADDKTLARIISRNKDVIGEGVKHEIAQMEGDRSVTRTIELFNFKQIFQMLRFSKSRKANEFMEFTALTMEQLLNGKADLVFQKEEDRMNYVQQVKDILSRCKSLGISKSKASVLIQQAKLTDKDPEILIFDELKAKEELEVHKKRGRVRERIAYLAKTYFGGSHEEAWHEFSEYMRYEIGVDMRHIRSEKKKANKPVPGYLDLIEKYDAFKEAEKIIKKMDLELSQL